MKLRAIFLACLLLSLPADAMRQLATFGPTNVVVNGTDSICTSFTGALSGSSIVFNCVSGGPPPPSGAPTGCVAKINNGTVNIVLPSTGGSATLSVACVTPTSGISFNWSKNGVSGVSLTNSWVDNYPANGSTTTDANYNYQVVACVGVSCVTVPVTPIAVIVSHASSTWSGTCPGFDATHIIDFNWAAPIRQFTANAGGFAANDIVVVRFTTGGGVSPSNNLSKVGGGEYIDPPSARFAVLSATPCDFGPQPMPGATQSGYTITVPFALGGGNNFGYYPQLDNFKTYYLNVKNVPNAACTAGNSCNMYFDLSHPGV